jgi:hypothetical protein
LFFDASFFDAKFLMPSFLMPSFFDAKFQSPEHRYCGIGRARGTCVSPALIGDIRTGGGRGRFEYATAPTNVNETAGEVWQRAWAFAAADPHSEKDRGALQARAVPQDR